MKNIILGLLVVASLILSGCYPDNSNSSFVKVYFPYAYQSDYDDYGIGDELQKTMRLEPGEHSLIINAVNRDRTLKKLYVVKVNCRLGYKYYIGKDGTITELPNSEDNRYYESTMWNKNYEAYQKKQSELHNKRVEEYNNRKNRERDAFTERMRTQQKILQEERELDEKREKERKAKALAEEKKRIEAKKAYREKHPFTVSVKVKSDKLKEEYKKTFENSKDAFKKSLEKYDLIKSADLHGAVEYEMEVDYVKGKLVYTINVSDFSPANALTFRSSLTGQDYIKLYGLTSYVHITNDWIDQVRESSKDETFKSSLWENPHIFISLKRKVNNKECKLSILTSINKNKFSSTYNVVEFGDTLIYESDNKKESFKTRNRKMLHGRYEFILDEDKLSKDEPKYMKAFRVLSSSK